VQLETAPPNGRVLLAVDDVTGRLVCSGRSPYTRSSYKVVIDGREMAWEQFGQTLEAFEGFRFRLVIEANVDEEHDGTDLD
jgi:hypothetical protein